MKTVMCFGTFDKLHPGHLSYLKQARKYGDKLVVVVARDQNVIKIKGRLPREDEKARLKKVVNSELADKVVLGQMEDRLSVVKKYKPDVVCLGYDQEVSLDELKKVFKGKIVRCRAYKNDIYKSSLIS